MDRASALAVATLTKSGKTKKEAIRLVIGERTPAYVTTLFRDDETLNNAMSIVYGDSHLHLLRETYLAVLAFDYGKYFKQREVGDKRIDYFDFEGLYADGYGLFISGISSQNGRISPKLIDKDFAMKELAKVESLIEKHKEEDRTDTMLTISYKKDE